MNDHIPEEQSEWLRVLADKNAIREQLLRFSRGVDRADAKLVDSVYWPDACDEHGAAGTLRGSECSSAFIGRASYKASQHHLTNILIELHGDTAYAESYALNFLIIERNGKEFTRSMGARYIDRFERRNGEWRIAHRVMVHDWSRLDEVVEAWPAGKDFIQGERTANDMVYTISRGVSDAHSRVPGAHPLPMEPPFGKSANEPEGSGET